MHSSMSECPIISIDKRAISIMYSNITVIAFASIARKMLPVQK